MCTQPSLGWCVFFLRSIFFVRFFVIHAASFPLLRFVPFHIASSFCPTRVGMRMQVTTHLVLVLRNCLMMTLVFTSFHPCTIHLHAIHPCLLVMHSSSWHGSLSTCSIVVHGFHRGPHGCCRSTSIPCRAHVALVSSIQSASLRRAFDHTRYVNPWQRGRKEGRKTRTCCFPRGWKSVSRVAWTVGMEETHVQMQTKRSTSGMDVIERRTDTCEMDGRGCGHVDHLRIFQVHLRYDRREWPCERG